MACSDGEGCCSACGCPGSLASPTERTCTNPNCLTSCTGVGRALAEEFLRCGDCVIITSRSGVCVQKLCVQELGASSIPCASCRTAWLSPLYEDCET